MDNLEAWVTTNETTLQFPVETYSDRSELLVKTIEKIKNDKQNSSTSSIKAVKILIRDTQLSRKLEHDSSFHQILVDLITTNTLPNSSTNIFPTAIICLECFFNILYHHTAITNIITEHFFNHLLDISIKKFKNVSDIQLIRTSSMILVLATHKNSSTIPFLDSRKWDMLTENNPHLIKVLFACLEQNKATWLGQDPNFHAKLISLGEKLVSSDGFKEGLSLLFSSSYGIDLVPTDTALFVICDHLDTPDDQSFYCAAKILSHYCRYSSRIRKLVCAYILPRRTRAQIIANKPEDDECIGARVIKRFTSPLDMVRYLSTELVFILCKENIDRFTRRTGFGNAIGFLNNLGKSKNEGHASASQLEPDFSDNESDNENSDEDFENCKKNGEYNPVTGKFQVKTKEDFDNMNEDDKEREARKLAALMSDMAKKGVIKPMGMDENGMPVEVATDERLIYESVKEFSGVKVDDCSVESD